MCVREERESQHSEAHTPCVLSWYQSNTRFREKGELLWKGWMVAAEIKQARYNMLGMW